MLEADSLNIRWNSMIYPLRPFSMLALQYKCLHEFDIEHKGGSFRQTALTNNKLMHPLGLGWLH